MGRGKPLVLDQYGFLPGGGLYLRETEEGRQAEIRDEKEALAFGRKLAKASARYHDRVGETGERGVRSDWAAAHPGYYAGKRCTRYPRKPSCQDWDLGEGTGPDRKCVKHCVAPPVRRKPKEPVPVAEPESLFDDFDWDWEAVPFGPGSRGPGSGLGGPGRGVTHDRSQDRREAI